MNVQLRLAALSFVTWFILSLFYGCAATPPEGSAIPEGKAKAISFGQEINLKDHLVKGKTVVFDFFSEYCPPCRRISPLLEKLDEKRDDVVVVKIDINRPGTRGIDWGSPVARQYELQGIPHFKIFSPEGKLVAEGDQAYDQVRGMLAKENIQ